MFYLIPGGWDYSAVQSPGYPPPQGGILIGASVVILYFATSLCHCYKCKCTAKLNVTVVALHKIEEKGNTGDYLCISKKDSGKRVGVHVNGQQKRERERERERERV